MQEIIEKIKSICLDVRAGKIKFRPENEIKTCCGENGCNGTGTVIRDDGRAFECPKHLKSRVDKEWGLKPPLTLQGLCCNPGIKKTKSIKAVLELSSHIKSGKPPRCLILLGGHGTSKTTSGESLVYTYQLKRFKTLRISWFDLVNWSKHGVEGFDKLDSFFIRMNSSRIVLIDELCNSSNVKHDDELMRRIIANCFDSNGYPKRFLILISNLQYGDFWDWLSSYAQSRLNPDYESIEYCQESFSDDVNLRKKHDL